MNTTTIRKLAGIAIFALAGVSLSHAAPAPSGADAAAEIQTEKAKLVVHINDLQARSSFDAERVREDALRQAFYEAARRNKWLGDYEFTYNRSVATDERAGYLEFNVIDWRRSPAGMFRFAASATYWNADGEKIHLGSFDGMSPSIAVFNRWDVGDQFVDTAEDAFGSALRKLKQATVAS